MVFTLPILQTDRLLLRALSMDDAEDVFNYGSNPHVSQYVTWNTHRSIEDTQEFIKFALERYQNKQVAPWGMEYKETGKLIGTIDFISWNQKHKTAEIGYVLSEDYWSKGLTTEAAKAVIDYGFSNMDLARIQARCFVQNVGSSRVMEKAGMTFEGIIRKGMYVRGKHEDLKLYAILDDDFFAQ